jgi:hypothetical protein
VCSYTKFRIFCAESAIALKWVQFHDFMCKALWGGGSNDALIARQDPVVDELIIIRGSSL